MWTQLPDPCAETKRQLELAMEIIARQPGWQVGVASETRPFVWRLRRFIHSILGR